MQLAWIHGLLALLSFHIHSAVAEIPGVCVFTRMVTRVKYVMDRDTGVWRTQIYKSPVQSTECCEGYEPKSRNPLMCSPVCEPNCEKSDCMAPNTCVCYPGHQLVNNSTSTCYDVCDSCVNSACVGANSECTCYPNYKRDQNFPHICDPICSPLCENAKCSAPNKCECFDGFVKHNDSSLGHVCIPKCSNGCSHGKCTAPEFCTCDKGYVIYDHSPGYCQPFCNHTCENGDCTHPNVCSCKTGFELHPRNQFQCLLSPPENHSLSYCELSMPKAIKYDKDEECFVMKDKVLISGPDHCEVLRPLSLSSCSQASTCNLNECIKNFRCSAKQLNGTKEIHCFLEVDDFETDSDTSSNITGSDWTDVTLVLNSFQHVDHSVYDELDQTRVWTLHPLSKVPVCGQMQFAVEIRNCDSESGGQPAASLNSSFMTWINVFLVIGFLFLVGIGVGGFLLARYRRLNDPLNYREDMMRGFYNNECYDSQPVELVSDDDEGGHDLDAPL